MFFLRPPLWRYLCRLQRTTILLCKISCVRLYCSEHRVNDSIFLCMISLKLKMHNGNKDYVAILSSVHRSQSANTLDYQRITDVVNCNTYINKQYKINYKREKKGYILNIIVFYSYILQILCTSHTNELKLLFSPNESIWKLQIQNISD